MLRYVRRLASNSSGGCATIIQIGLLVALAVRGLAEGGDDTLRYYLSRSELVIAAEISSNPDAESSEGGRVVYLTPVTILQVLYGKPLATSAISVSIGRFGFADDDRIPYLKKGGRCILFLKRFGAAQASGWVTVDSWFGIQPYGSALARTLKRIAEADAEAARWEWRKQLRGNRAPEDVDLLLKVADSADKEVAVEAISDLSDYRDYPESGRIVDLLKKKMAHPDPEIALAAATTGCYLGDCSGVPILLNDAQHGDPKVRLQAIAQLGDSIFQYNAREVVPVLLERLRAETDPSLIERIIDSLGAYPSSGVLNAVVPFLDNPDESVRARAQLTIDRLKPDVEDKRRREKSGAPPEPCEPEIP